MCVCTQSACNEVSLKLPFWSALFVYHLLDFAIVRGALIICRGSMVGRLIIAVIKGLR